eukprot:5938709-Pyramimonas_sp.AAC.1
MQKERVRLLGEVEVLRAANKGKGQFSEAAKATEEVDTDETQIKALAHFDEELRSLRGILALSQYIRGTVDCLDEQSSKLLDEVRSQKPVLAHLVALQRKLKAKQDAIVKREKVVAKVEEAVANAQKALEDE